MQIMQADILKKCATHSEVLNLRGEVRDLEETNRKFIENNDQADKF